MKKVWAILGAVALLAGLCGTMMAVENHYAKDDDLRLVEYRLNQKILDDQIYQLQRRVWAYEDQYGGIGVPLAPPSVKQQYRQMVYKLNELKRKAGK